MRISPDRCDKITAELEVRPATIDDADGIRALTKQLVAFRGKIFNEERFMFGLKKRVKLNSESHHFFVCTLDGEIAGMTLVEMIPTDKTEVYLNTLFVGKNYQKKGVGKKMFDFIIPFLQDIGIKTIIINIRKNEPMEVSFFEKFGFQVDFELKPFTCMVKKL